MLGRLGTNMAFWGRCARSIALPIRWAPWMRDLLEVSVLYKKLYQPVLDAHDALGMKASLGVRACLALSGISGCLDAVDLRPP